MEGLGGRANNPETKFLAFIEKLGEEQEMPNNLALSVDSLTPEQVRMMEFAAQGFHCSEILLFMGLEAQGKTDPDLIRTVSALAGGIGFSGETCGALTRRGLFAQSLRRKRHSSRAG